MGEEPGRYLRRQLRVLIQHWRLIAVIALVAASAALVASLLIRPKYVAEAGVIIVKYKSVVSLESRFQTLSEEELAAAGSQEIWNLAARRRAFADLVSNGAIAEQVIAELGERLDPKQRQPATLLETVKGTVYSNSDLIRITVSDRKPDRAEAIANAWARIYEQQVNAAFSGAAGTYPSVQAEWKKARDEYQTAEKALTAFIAENRIADLKRLISEKGTLVNKLQEAKQIVFEEQVEEKTQRLRQLYTSKAKLEQLLDDARGLQAQAQAGGSGGSATNSLAILLLKAQVFGSSVDLPGDVQLQVGTTSSLDSGPDAQVTDLDALNTVLQERIADLEARIRILSQGLLSSTSYGFLTDATALKLVPTSPVTSTTSYSETVATSDSLEQAIVNLQDEVRQLEAQLEQETARKQELESARDLALTAYDTLSSKVAEVGVESAVIGSEVRFVAPAVTPVRPASPKKLQNTALAGVLGLMVGMLAAFVVEYWRGLEQEKG